MTQRTYYIDVRYSSNNDYRNTMVVKNVSRETLEHIFELHRFTVSRWRWVGDTCPFEDFVVYVQNDARYRLLLKILFRYGATI